jgi:hypothetical protein
MYLLEEYPLADIVTYVAKYNQASCATGSSSTSSPPTRSRLWPPSADSRPGPEVARVPARRAMESHDQFWSAGAVFRQVPSCLTPK